MRNWIDNAQAPALRVPVNINLARLDVSFKPEKFRVFDSCELTVHFDLATRGKKNTVVVVSTQANRPAVDTGRNLAVPDAHFPRHAVSDVGCGVVLINAFKAQLEAEARGGQ